MEFGGVGALQLGLFVTVRRPAFFVTAAEIVLLVGSRYSFAAALRRRMNITPAVMKARHPAVTPP